MKYNENDTLDVLTRRLSLAAAEGKGICFLPVGSVKGEGVTALCRAAKEIRKRTVKPLTILALTMDMVAMGRMALAIRACGFEGAAICKQDGMRFLATVHGGKLSRSGFPRLTLHFPKRTNGHPTMRWLFIWGSRSMRRGWKRRSFPRWTGQDTWRKSF